MATEWTYRGQTFQLDLDDLAGLARYDDALAAQRSAFAELPAGASEPAQLLAYCEGIRRLLATLFDADVDALLDGSSKPSDYDMLYESFMDFVREQTAETAERRAAMLRKYKPDPNREQKRAMEKLVKKAGKKKDK